MLRHVARLLPCLLMAVRAGGTPPLPPAGTLDGWELVSTSPAPLAESCRWTTDGVLAVTGRPTSFLASTTTHADYVLHVEWRWPEKPGNGGVLVHIRSGPKDRAWPLCYQVQLKHGAAGDLLPMAGATFAEPLTSAPGTTPVRAHLAPDSEKPPGEWNSCVITCRGDTLEVSINGVPQNRISGCSLRSGQVGLQLEGAPFEIRGLRLTPLP